MLYPQIDVDVVAFAHCCCCNHGSCHNCGMVLLQLRRYGVACLSPHDDTMLLKCSSIKFTN